MSSWARTAAVLASLLVALGVAALPGVAAPPGVQADAHVRREAPASPENAAEIARRTGQPVEILSQRTETARVFANPSGTRTPEQYVLPVRVERDGEWVPIDTRLSRNPDGSVSPGATVTGLRLSGGGTGPLVTATMYGGGLCTSWPWALPAPVLDVDTATYPEVLPGVDLRIRFQTATKGLALRAEEDGGSVAVDPAGKPVYDDGAAARLVVIGGDRAGTWAETVVQLRDVHSDKCLQVSGASTSNGAAIVQGTCATPAPTNQLFNLRVEP